MWRHKYWTLDLGDILVGIGEYVNKNYELWSVAIWRRHVPACEYFTMGQGGGLWSKNPLLVDTCAQQVNVLDVA